MATTNLCVAIFRVNLVREPMQTARNPEEDFGGELLSDWW